MGYFFGGPSVDIIEYYTFYSVCTLLVTRYYIGLDLVIMLESLLFLASSLLYSLKGRISSFCLPCSVNNCIFMATLFILFYFVFSCAIITNMCFKHVLKYCTVLGLCINWLIKLLNRLPRLDFRVKLVLLLNNFRCSFIRREMQVAPMTTTHLHSVTVAPTATVHYTVEVCLHEMSLWRPRLLETCNIICNVTVTPLATRHHTVEVCLHVSYACQRFTILPMVNILTVTIGSWTILSAKTTVTIDSNVELWRARRL